MLAVVASALSPDPRVAPRLAHDLGVSGLQFDAFSPSLDITDLSQTGRREFVRVLAGSDQQLAGLRVDLGNKGFGPGADVDRLLSQMTKVMAAAAGLQSPLVCVEMGPLPEPPPVERVSPKVTQDMAGMLILPSSVLVPAPAPVQAGPAIDPALQASVDGAMLELANRADRIGVMLALRSDLASYAALERVLGVARCPWFGIDLDPVALMRDAWPADEVFSRLGATFRHVRSRDAVRGADNRTKALPIGRGDTRWDELLQNLDAAGYRGWLTIDPLELTDRVAGATGAVKYLKLHGVG